MRDKVIILKEDDGDIHVIFASKLEGIHFSEHFMYTTMYYNKTYAEKILMYNGKPSQYLHDESKTTDIHGQVHEYKWVSIRDNINTILEFIQHDEG